MDGTPQITEVNVVFGCHQIEQEVEDALEQRLVVIQVEHLRWVGIKQGHSEVILTVTVDGQSATAQFTREQAATCAKGVNREDVRSKIDAMVTALARN